jgi:hypothetical protein
MSVRPGQAHEALSSVHPDSNDGQAIAYAARAGYHPSIVRMGCDLSPEISLDAKWEDAYIALYFASRIEAEIAANSLPTELAAYLSLRVYPVTTPMRGSPPCLVPPDASMTCQGDAAPIGRRQASRLASQAANRSMKSATAAARSGWDRTFLRSPSNHPTSVPST